MFNCEVCGTTVPPGTPCHVIVAQTMEVEHPYRPRANRIKIEDKWEFSDDPGGYGKQIKKELRVCPDCQHYSPELAE
jgi:hypothetical protein